MVYLIGGYEIPPGLHNPELAIPVLIIDGYVKVYEVALRSGAMLYRIGGILAKFGNGEKVVGKFVDSLRSILCY